MKTKQPRQSKVRSETSIESGRLYFEDVCQCSMDDELFQEMLDDKHLIAIRVVSLAHNWHEREWYAPDVQLNINLEMTLRKERRAALDHWYAYRRVGGQLFKRYVGHSEQVTEKRLVEVAQHLPG